MFCKKIKLSLEYPANPFFPMFPFDPPENLRKPKVFWYFQGGLKENIGRKRANSRTGFINKMNDSYF